MRSSPRRDFSVYEFNEADESVESVSKGFLRKFGKFRNPISRSSPINKYSFLQSFAQGSDVLQKKVNDVLYIDFDESDENHKCDSHSYTIGTSKRDVTIQQVSGLDDIEVSTSRNSSWHAHINGDNFETRNLIPECSRMDSLEMGSLEPPPMHNKQLNGSFMELTPEKEKLVDIISDDDKSLKQSSRSTSHLAENEGTRECTTEDHCFGSDGEMEKKVNMEVAFSPDFVLYGDRQYSRPQLTFSFDLVKLEDLSAQGSNESHSFEWTVDDIVCVECRKIDSVDITLVKLWLGQTDVKVSDASGISKLTFAVSDSQWQEKEQMITSLSAHYKAIWNTIPNSEMADDEEDTMGQNSLFFLKRYFSCFDEHFDDVVYPKGDPDAVSISKRDIELLQPETFINDTIIDFYIKYLRNRIQPNDKQRFHFFNSFFFRKLADLDKDPGSALEGRAAFLRVRKWTRKVNIFGKDYVFIPINFNLHWSLIVICHPGEIAFFKDEGIKSALKVPCILHMDSMKGSHRCLKNLIQSYLWEEWKERQGESSEDVSFRFSNLRFIPLELPQQENSFDCGLFLLQYVELFLEEAPVNFNPFRISKFSNFLSPDWFPSAEASHKRSDIHKLIYEILDNQSPCKNKNNFKAPENDSKKEDVEVLFEHHGPTKRKFLGNSISSTYDGGVKVKLSAPSSPGAVLYGKERDTVPLEFFEQGDVAECYPDKLYTPFPQLATFEKLVCTMSTIKEDAESDEQIVFSSSDKGHWPPKGMQTEECIILYASKDVGALEMLSPEILSQPKEEHGDRSSSSKWSSCGSPTSSEIGVSESETFACSNEQIAAEQSRLSSPGSSDAPESPSLAFSEGLEDCVVQDSPERDSCIEAMGESKESGDSFFSCPENLTSIVSSHQDAELGKDCELLGDDVQATSVSLEATPNQKRQKRMKLVPPKEQQCTWSKARGQ